MLAKWFSKRNYRASAGIAAPRQSKPKELLSAVGRDLVMKMNQDPDWVWALMNVTRPSADDQSVVLFRVFDPHEAMVRRVTVKNFQFLDEHPELILYHGWVDTKNNSVEVIDSRQYPPKLERTH